MGSQQICGVSQVHRVHVAPVLQGPVLPVKLVDLVGPNQMLSMGHHMQRTSYQGGYQLNLACACWPSALSKLCTMLSTARPCCKDTASSLPRHCPTELRTQADRYLQHKQTTRAAQSRGRHLQALCRNRFTARRCRLWAVGLVQRLLGTWQRPTGTLAARQTGRMATMCPQQSWSPVERASLGVT